MHVLLRTPGPIAQLVTTYEVAILAAYTAPANMHADPVIVLADTTDPAGAVVASGMRSANIGRQIGPIVLGTVSAAEMVAALVQMGAGAAPTARQLQQFIRGSLFVVTLSQSIISSSYFAVDATTGKLGPVQRRVKPKAAAPPPFSIN
jgi:hypothetical protein